MLFNQIKSTFRDSVFYVASHIDSYSVSPGKDFTRRRILPTDMLISFLVSQGASSTGNELIDFFDFSSSTPSLSALNQQRDKLKPDALEAVFHLLNQSTSSASIPSKYRFLAADGSTLSFFSKPSLASDDYFVSEGHSSKGFYSIHLNALYDLSSHSYVDAILQPVRHKDEFRAFCDMVDRLDPPPGHCLRLPWGSGILFLQRYGTCSGKTPVFSVSLQGCLQPGNGAAPAGSKRRGV